MYDVYKYVCVRVYVCMNVYMYVWMYVCMYVRVHVHMYVCVCMHVVESVLEIWDEKDLVLGVAYC
jgi:hypothetical protein